MRPENARPAVGHGKHVENASPLGASVAIVLVSPLTVRCNNGDDEHNFSCSFDDLVDDLNR